MNKINSLRAAGGLLRAGGGLCRCSADFAKYYSCNVLLIFSDNAKPPLKDAFFMYSFRYLPPKLIRITVSLMTQWAQAEYYLWYNKLPTFATKTYQNCQIFCISPSCQTNLPSFRPL